MVEGQPDLRQRPRQLQRRRRRLRDQLRRRAGLDDPQQSDLEQPRLRDLALPDRRRRTGDRQPGDRQHDPRRERRPLGGQHPGRVDRQHGGRQRALERAREPRRDFRLRQLPERPGERPQRRRGSLQRRRRRHLHHARPVAHGDRPGPAVADRDAGRALRRPRQRRLPSEAGQRRARPRAGARRPDDAISRERRARRARAATRAPTRASARSSATTTSPPPTCAGRPGRPERAVPRRRSEEAKK